MKSLRCFIWRGIDARGFKVMGKLLAADPQAARTTLSQQSITLLRLQRDITITGWLPVRRIKPADITAFSVEIAALIASGIALAQALRILVENTVKLPMKTLIQTITQQVEGGNLFAHALKTQAHYFDALFYNLVQVGETSGTLDVVLQHIALHREKMARLKQKIRKALFYPLLVLCVALGVTAAMLVFVMPQFERLFQSMGAELPLFTRWVLDVSKMLQQYGGWILLGVLLTVAILRMLSRRVVMLQVWRDRLLLKIPILGNVLLEAIFARCFRTVAMTLRSGLPLLDALRLTADIAGHFVYQRAFTRIADMIQQGQALSHALQKAHAFPARVLQLVAIGEESGRLDDLLQKLSNYYETQVDNKIQLFSQLLEPALMLFLCVIVGGLVIAMYMPIFRLGAIV